MKKEDFIRHIIKKEGICIDLSCHHCTIIKCTSLKNGSLDFEEIYSEAKKIALIEEIDIFDIIL